MIFLQHALWKNSNRTSNFTYCSYFVLLLMAFVTASANATLDDIKNTLGPSGSVRGAFWSKDKNFRSGKSFGVGQVWLKLQPPEILGFRSYVEGYVIEEDLSGNNGSNGVSSASGVLREAYIEKSFGQFDLKVGRQIIVWGRADKVNPTDSFSVKNFKRLFTDDEDQRMGPFAGQLSYTTNQNLRMTAIWQPEWISPVYPIPPQQMIELVTIEPPKPEKQFGLKIDKSGDVVDWSLSYFNGYNKVPNLSLMSATPRATTVGLNFDRVQTYGADAATIIGDYGVRGEVAYTRTSDDTGKDYFKQNSYLYGVLGGDRSFWDTYNVNVQVLYRHTMDFQDPNSYPVPALLPLLKTQSIISMQQKKDLWGASLRPSVKLLHETLDLEVAYVTWFYKNNFLLRPKATYALSDQWKAIVGGEIYGGSQDSFFGRLKKASAVFSELRFLF